MNIYELDAMLDDLKLDRPENKDLIDFYENERVKLLAEISKKVGTILNNADIERVYYV